MKPNNKKSIYRVLIVGAVLVLIFEAIIFGIASYNRQSKISDLYPKAVGMKTQVETVFARPIIVTTPLLPSLSQNYAFCEL